MSQPEGSCAHTYPRVCLVLCDRVEQWTGPPQWAKAITGVEVEAREGTLTSRH